MTKAPAFELSPEFVAVQAELDALDEQRRAIQERYNVFFQERKDIKNLWWEENISEFDLFDSEDFRELGIEAWNGGSGGSEVIPLFIDETLKSEGVNRFLFREGHVGRSDKSKDYLFSLNSFTLSLEGEISEGEYTKLASVLTRIQSAAGQWKNDYSFRVNGIIREDDDDDHYGYAPYVLYVNKKGSYVQSEAYGRPYTFIKQGNLVDVLKEIRSCSGD